ncbi:MAG TPA: DUF2892 domain-containing protein [Sphingomicrobium sp.]|nr:DUF2892 domain-containing protein [Sphingomicrobium sp.]
MLKNIGKADRVFRLCLAGLLVFLAVTTAVDGGLEIAFYIVGAYALITAVVGHCPIFRMLDIDSHLHAGEYHSGPSE